MLELNAKMITVSVIVNTTKNHKLHNPASSKEAFVPKIHVHSYRRDAVYMLIVCSLHYVSGGPGCSAIRIQTK